MTTVSLEAAKALKAAGMDQDQWPQIVWVSYDDEGTDDDLCYQDGSGDVTERCVWEHDRVYAAPDPLSALVWLEKEHHIGWHRLVTMEWAAFMRGSSVVSLVADTPDALIIAVCSRLITAGAAAVLEVQQ